MEGFLLAVICLYGTTVLGSPHSVAQVQPKPLDWWQTTTFYQIYPRSFKDSDGDGIGDLKGITEKIDYLKELGIGAVWLSPVFKSPMVDFGYDISDFREIAPIFGTMDDFDALKDRIKKADLKLILDFVPNHSSDQHVWFQKSINKEDPYTDYYVWHDGRENCSDSGECKRMPPSNWVSNFGGPAWTWNDQRKQYYLHQFGYQQPDLNFRSSHVVQEMKDILKFWLDKGVDGFRMDAVSHMFEDDRFLDESPRANPGDALPTEFTYHDHIYMLNQPETYDMVREWRVMFDEINKKDGITRIIMTEIQHNSTIEKTVAYYGNETHPLAHVPFNFKLFHLNRDSSAHDFKALHHLWLDHMPAGMWANWIWGNHDTVRPASRFYRELIDGINMLGLLVPGVAIVYNGDELGMTDAYIRWDQTIDPMAFRAGPTRYRKWSRDGCRTPFQWDSSLSAGFSTKIKTALPVNPNFWTLNVKQQLKDNYSNLKVFKRLVELRKKTTIKRGSVTFYPLADWVLVFTREYPNFPTYVVIINLGSDFEITKGLSTVANLPQNLTVVVPSISSGFEVGRQVDTNNILLRPKASLVLTTTPPSQGHMSSSGNRLKFSFFL